MTKFYALGDIRVGKMRTNMIDFIIKSKGFVIDLYLTKNQDEMHVIQRTLTRTRRVQLSECDY